SREGTLRCLASRPGAPAPLAANDFIGINSTGLNVWDRLLRQGEVSEPVVHARAQAALGSKPLVCEIRAREPSRDFLTSRAALSTSRPACRAVWGGSGRRARTHSRLDAQPANPHLGRLSMNS